MRVQYLENVSNPPNGLQVWCCSFAFFFFFSFYVFYACFIVLTPTQKKKTNSFTLILASYKLSQISSEGLSGLKHLLPPHEFGGFALLRDEVFIMLLSGLKMKDFSSTLCFKHKTTSLFTRKALALSVSLSCHVTILFIFQFTFNNSHCVSKKSQSLTCYTR